MGWDVSYPHIHTELVPPGLDDEEDGPPRLMIGAWLSEGDASGCADREVSPMAKVRGRISLAELGKAGRRAAVRGLSKGTEHLLGASLQIVPLEAGDLAASGTASVDAGALRGAVSYSGEYAVIQHEHSDYRHAGGRRDHFLSTPMHAEAKVIGQIIATEIRRGMQR